MVWKQNIIEDFEQLVSFDSISFYERKTADWQVRITVVIPEICMPS